MRRTRSSLLVTALVLVAGCSSGSGATPAQDATSAAPTSAAPTGAAGDALRIAGFAYQPNPITVKPGAVLTVTNNDSADHTVTSDTSGLFSVGASQGSPVTLTAPTTPGTYAFHCGLHPSMHGTLVVKS